MAEQHHGDALPGMTAPTSSLTTIVFRITLILSGLAGAIAIGWSLAAAWHYREVLPEADMRGDLWRHFTLPFTEYMATPAAEHILVFPHLFYLADWYIGRADGSLLQVAIFVVLALETLLLVAGGSDPVARRLRVSLLWLPICATFLFWLCDWANFVFPIQLHMYLSLCFGIGALLVQVRLPADGGSLRLWAFLCLGSLFSFGIGLGWVSALAVLALVQPLAASLRWRLLCLALLLLALAATVMLTLGAPRPQGELWSNLARPFSLVAYVHQGITSYDFWLRGVIPSWLVQAGAFACYAALLSDLALHRRQRRPLDRRRVFGLGLMLAIAVTYLVAGVARLDLPGSEPYANRYMTLPPLFWIGAAIYLNACLPRRRAVLRLLAQGSAAVALVALVLSTQARFLAMAQPWILHSRHAEAAIANETLPVSVLNRLTICATCDDQVDWTHATIAFLKEQNSSLFSRPGLDLKGRAYGDLPRLRGTHCKVTLVSEEVPGARGPVLEFSGKARSQGATLLAVLVVDRTEFVRSVGWPTDSWLPRGDWVAYMDPVVPASELRAVALVRSGGVTGLCATP